MFRQHLVKTDPARLRIATGVGHAQFVQLGLHRAVFAVGAVQRQEHHLAFRGASCQPGLRGSSSIDHVPERPQRRRHRRAGAQRNFALGARPAQHHGDVQLRTSSLASIFPDNFHFRVQFDPALGFRAFAWISSIKSKTSCAVALPSLTIKLPCSSETIAPPTRAFQAQLLNQVARRESSPDS